MIVGFMRGRRLLSALALSGATLLGASVARAQPTVRAGHPRIFLTADGRRGISVATLRARCEATAQVWARGCRAGAPIPNPSSETPVRNAEHPLINLALRYLLYQEPSVLDVLRQQLSRTPAFGDRQDPLGQVLADAATVRELAISYDWLYNDLSTSDRASYVSSLRAWGDWLLANTPQDVFASESFVHASMLGLIGLAFANDPETASDATRYLRAVDDRWKTVLLPSLAATGDFWPEGAGAFTTLAARSSLYLAAAWTTATTEDLFATTRTRGGDAFNRWSRYLSYWLRPDLRFAPYGDASDRQLNPAGSLRPVLDMLAWGTGASLPHNLGDELSRRLATATDYNGPEAWHLVVFYDPIRPQRDGRAGLPLAAHLSPGVGDAVVLRSSWDDTEATWISLTCGDWLTTRQHLDVGGLQVFRRAPLLGSTGTYDGFETQHWLGWYAQRSVHASTLSVLDPAEMFMSPRLARPINEGGQRLMDYASVSARASVNVWRANLTAGAQYETGSVTSFESAEFHDYVACDATRAYNSTRFTAAPNSPKAREVTRQLVYLRPDVILVFDRVEVTDPRFERRVAFHALSRPVLSTEGVASVQREGGRAIVRTLSPASARRAVIDGYVVGTEEIPSLAANDVGRGARLEVSATGPARREYFFHLIHVADSASAPVPTTTLIEDGDRLGVRFVDGESGREFTVSFERESDLGGRIQIVSPEGMTLYAGRLGAGGVVYPPTADAGVVELDAGGVTADGGVTPPSEPGCSCRAGQTRGAPWGLALLALLRRRRRVSR